MSHLRVSMPDNSVWEIPTNIIEDDMRKHYGNPLEEFDEDDIIDWASNNMEWEDVVGHASIYEEPSCDYAEGWVNGHKEVL